MKLLATITAASLVLVAADADPVARVVLVAAAAIVLPVLALAALGAALRGRP